MLPQVWVSCDETTGTCWSGGEVLLAVVLGNVFQLFFEVAAPRGESDLHRWDTEACLQ